MMVDLWYPSAKRAPVPYLPQEPLAGYPNRGVLHCTEGRSFAGSYGTYDDSRKAPQFTCTYENGRFEIYQHFPANKNGYSLRNNAGGYHTNRAGVCVQIEIVGTCDRYRSNLNIFPAWARLWQVPQGYADGIRNWMRWIEAKLGIKPVMPVTFLTYPDSYGSRNGQRLSAEAWAKLNGWCAHQNVPEGNDHGDFGDFGSQTIGGPRYLLSGGAPAVPSPPPQAQKDDDMILIARFGPDGSTWACNPIRETRKYLDGDMAAAWRAVAAKGGAVDVGDMPAYWLGSFDVVEHISLPDNRIAREGGVLHTSQLLTEIAGEDRAAPASEQQVVAAVDSRESDSGN